jgi:hypothetical protein
MKRKPLTPMQKARAGVAQTVSSAEGKRINAAMQARKAVQKRNKRKMPPV